MGEIAALPLVGIPVPGRVIGGLAIRYIAGARFNYLSRRLAHLVSGPHRAVLTERGYFLSARMPATPARSIRVLLCALPPGLGLVIGDRAVGIARQLGEQRGECPAARRRIEERARLDQAAYGPPHRHGPDDCLRVHR